MTQTPKVFAREATGLIRSVSPLAVVVTTIVLTNYGLGMATFEPFTPYLYPGADLGMVALFAIPFLLVIALNYIVFTIAVPRAGGDYVWISRVVTPIIAVGFAFWFVIYNAVFWGSLTNYTVSYFLGAGIETTGFALSNPGLISAASFFTTPGAIIGIGTVIIAAATVALMIPVKTFMKTLIVFWGLGMLAILISVGLYVGSSHTGFVNTFNTDFRADNVTYSGIIAQAGKLGFSNPGLVSLGLPTLFAVPFMILSLNGYQMGAYFAGEIRSVRRSMWIAGIAGGLVSVFFYWLVGYTFQHVAGADFVNAIAYIEYASPSNYTLPIPWSNFLFSMILTTNPVLIVLMVVGLFAWGIAGLAAVAFAASRILLAAGFDRVLPSAISMVSSRFGTPIVAILIYMIITEFGLIFSVYAGLIFSFLNITLVFCALYAFVGFTSVIFPYVKKGIYQMSPVARYKVAGIPAISVIGFANMLLSGFLFYFSLLNPGFSGPTGLPAILTLAGVFLAGSAIHLLTRFYYKGRGIDVKLAMSEIPPE